MAAGVEPEKETVPLVPELKVPLLSQSPVTVSVVELLTTKDPPPLIVILWQVTSLSTVIVVPFAIITSSPAPGTTPPTQLVGSLHNPPVETDVIVPAAEVFVGELL